MDTVDRRARVLTRGTRVVTVAACAAALLLVASAGAGARGTGDVGGVPGEGSGWHGPVVTHPAQPNVDSPRGAVCPFPVKGRFPVVDMTQKTWFNDAGDPVYAIVSGPLVMDATNLDTGKTVRRDISGTGTLSYPEPGSDTHILSGGDWGTLLHTGDRPVHNKWLISRGFMAVKYTESGGTTQRELLALEGRYEDLCRTLAGRPKD
ncbi:hypothetical protein [Streptomyces iconiensis]|uniref:Uncharacterized protein n=1 Tax=Streptomyces iconiensis TaxID=1384038 RepID=A0ABT6ZRY5_9ACTN|nr:hypothetical protein [Streptomyces iconiensis]MDJ1131824.1 hypothetical protein [Streptomyces iconiensis]